MLYCSLWFYWLKNQFTTGQTCGRSLTVVEKLLLLSRRVTKNENFSSPKRIQNWTFSCWLQADLQLFPDDLSHCRLGWFPPCHWPSEQTGLCQWAAGTSSAVCPVPLLGPAGDPRSRQTHWPILPAVPSSCLPPAAATNTLALIHAPTMTLSP